MKPTPFEKRRQGLGVLYGVAGGLVFAMLAWGFDALILADSLVVLPFGKFLPGLVACLVLGTLVGWLSVRIDKAVIALLLWIGLSVVLVRIVLWLPFTWMSWLIRQIHPVYSPFLDYPALTGTSQYIILGSIMLAILAGIAGLLENLLVDSALEKQGYGGVVGMILMVSLLLGNGGLLMDNMVNPDFRDSAAAIDKLIHFAVENKDNEVDPTVARVSHLKTMTQLGVEIFTKPHQLVMQTYDPLLVSQIDYLVDFSGDLYSCTTVNKTPILCKSLVN